MALQRGVIERWMEGMAGSGNYYQAYSSIPDLTSPAQRMNYYNRILLQEAMKKPMNSGWKAELEGRLHVYRWEFMDYEADNI